MQITFKLFAAALIAMTIGLALFVHTTRTASDDRISTGLIIGFLSGERDVSNGVFQIAVAPTPILFVSEPDLRVEPPRHYTPAI
ncbi:MAG: hypothetical protein AAGA05_02640 [Pseudomonadota bacterium]